MHFRNKCLYIPCEPSEYPMVNYCSVSQKICRQIFFFLSLEPLARVVAAIVCHLTVPSAIKVNISLIWKECALLYKRFCNNYLIISTKKIWQNFLLLSHFMALACLNPPPPQKHCKTWFFVFRGYRKWPVARDGLVSLLIRK